MNVLELFAGSRSVGKAAEAKGHKVFSVDRTAFENIDLVTDIGGMTAQDVPFVPDMVWASFDCTTYTIAAISTHRHGTEPKTEYAAKCDEVNQHVISLIKEWQKQNPQLTFYFENPRGMLRKMPFMQSFPRHTVWYCQYGDDRAKPTDIWTNDRNWKPRPMCWNGNKNCHHQPAPRGSKTGTQGRKGSYERSKIPTALITEILEVKPMPNDNFIGCCGTNTTLNIGEETYCHDCDTYAQVVGEEVTWDNGTATRFDYRGMLTEDAVTV